jgi:F0F1-type ATP synthase assembly protein I
MTTKPADISTSDKQLTRRARRAFFVGLFDLTWRLSGAMLLPLFVGMAIDSKIGGSGQSFSIIGFFIGMIFGVVVIRSIVKKLGVSEK